jgi:hypothetical protein
VKPFPFKARLFPSRSAFAARVKSCAFKAQLFPSRSAFAARVEAFPFKAQLPHHDARTRLGEGAEFGYNTAPSPAGELHGAAILLAKYRRPACILTTCAGARERSNSRHVLFIIRVTATCCRVASLPARNTALISIRRPDGYQASTGRIAD